MENSKPSFLEQLAGKLTFVEWMLWASVIMGALFQDQALVFFAVGLNLLALVMFIRAFLPLPLEPFEEGEQMGFIHLFGYSILPKVVYIGSAVSLMGVLFLSLGLEGAPNMIFIGGITVGQGVLFFLILFLNGIKQREKLFPVFLRILVVFLFLAYMVISNGMLDSLG
jgi:hypothetical protein